MFDKQNFQNGEEVIISKLGDEKEYKGIIVGKGLDHIVDFYIIKTHGRPFAPQYDFDCILLSESCLKRA